MSPILVGPVSVLSPGSYPITSPGEEDNYSPIYPLTHSVSQSLTHPLTQSFIDPHTHSHTLSTFPHCSWFKLYFLLPCVQSLYGYLLWASLLVFCQLLRDEESCWRFIQCLDAFSNNWRIHWSQLAGAILSWSADQRSSRSGYRTDSSSHWAGHSAHVYRRRSVCWVFEPMQHIRAVSEHESQLWLGAIHCVQGRTW